VSIKLKGSKIKKYYNIESIIWIDHTHVERGSLPDDPDNSVLPTLSFGVVIKETDKTLILVSEIERYNYGDDFSYTLIYKNAITGRKKYGTIELKNIK
jgi:hypothetical protein